MNMKCFFWRHELDVKTVSIRGCPLSIDWQTVKCNKCDYTIKIENWEVKEVK